MSHSEVFHQKLGYSIPTYAKQSDSLKHKRFLLAAKGDPIQKMEQITKDFEASITEEQKKQYVETQKRVNHDKIQEMSKTQQKKNEKSIQQSWSQTNSTLGQNLSLDNAIMYMQNVLSVIEHKISNEVRYSLHFKQVVSTQMRKLDISQ